MPGHHEDTVNEVYDLTGGRCLYCGKRLSFHNYGKVGERGAWEIDHFIPFTSRGRDGIENFVPACIACNTEKGRLMPWNYDPERFEVGDRDPENYL